MKIKNQQFNKDFLLRPYENSNKLPLMYQQVPRKQQRNKIKQTNSTITLLPRDKTFPWDPYENKIPVKTREKSEEKSKKTDSGHVSFI
jgi:hypothetical protein